MVVTNVLSCDFHFHFVHGSPFDVFPDDKGFQGASILASGATHRPFTINISSWHYSGTLRSEYIVCRSS